MARAEPTGRRELRSALLENLERLLTRIVERLDWHEAQRVGAELGSFAWRLSRRDHARTLEHLALAFPDLSASQRHQLGRESFRHLGTMLTESLWLLAQPPSAVAPHLAREGWPHLERARASGRPVVLLTGHCGNWELLGAATGLSGLRISGLARALDDPGLQRWLVGLRAHFGNRTIVRGEPGAVRDLLSVMRTNGTLCVLIDQDTRVDGCWIDFFGRPAWTPVGPAEIALRFGAVVLPAFVERNDDGSHLVRIEPALDLPTDPVAATQAMHDRIEAQIRRRPEQWVWLHRRWRRQPDTPRPARARPRA